MLRLEGSKTNMHLMFVQSIESELVSILRFELCSIVIHREKSYHGMGSAIESSIFYS